MATAEQSAGIHEQQLDKGLKSGALGLISTTVIATASVAPAYSIAATLVFVVGAVALQAPAVAVLAFVPMLLTSIGYSELNKADPDCGTTFSWTTKAFGPSLKLKAAVLFALKISARTSRSFRIDSRAAIWS